MIEKNGKKKLSDFPVEGAGQENPVGMSAGTCAAHHTYQ